MSVSIRQRRRTRLASVPGLVLFLVFSFAAGVSAAPTSETFGRSAAEAQNAFEVARPGGASVAASDDPYCEPFADIRGQTDGVKWTGGAVDCRRTWTYSFRLRYLRGGRTIEEHLLENKSGSTYYSFPTYTTPIYGTAPSGCAELRIYHGTQVGSNLVRRPALNCIGGITR